MLTDNIYYLSVVLILVFSNGLGQGKNLVLGGDFAHRIGDTIWYISVTGDGVWIVTDDYYEDIADTCYTFGHGFYICDSPFNGNSLEIGMPLIYKIRGKTFKGKTWRGMVGTMSFVCIPLRRSLDSGKIYKVSFYTKATSFSYYITRYIGIKFFDTCITGMVSLYEEYDVSWHADVGPDTIVSSERWIKVEGEYCARGGEKFVAVSFWLPEGDKEVVELLRMYREKGLYGSYWWGKVRIAKRIRKKILRRIAVINKHKKEPIGRKAFWGKLYKCKTYLDNVGEIWIGVPRKGMYYLVDEIEVVPTGKSCKDEESK